MARTLKESTVPIVRELHCLKNRDGKRNQHQNIKESVCIVKTQKELEIKTNNNENKA